MFGGGGILQQKTDLYVHMHACITWTALTMVYKEKHAIASSLPCITHTHVLNIDKIVSDLYTGKLCSAESIYF